MDQVNNNINIKKTIAQSLEISNELLINNFHYTFKKKFANEKYSYRCINKNICKT